MRCVLMDGISNYDYNVDVREAFKIIKNTSLGDFLTDFSLYSAGYIFSNENLSSYYPFFKMNGGRVLSVCGSGDQALMAILNGAVSVDCFDTNRMSFYILMLKAYSIKYLNYDDFICLFNISLRSNKRKNVFKKLCDLCKFDINSNKLSSSEIDVMNIVMCFWSSIFSDYSLSDLRNSSYNLNGNDIFPYLFKKRDESINESVERISYLNEVDFLKLKSRINDCEIRFINKDFEHVFDYFDGFYDFINLSNIFDYVSPDGFVKFIKCARNDHLSDSGSIMANYSWSEPGSIDKINNVCSIIGANQQLIQKNNIEGNVSHGSIMVCHK